MQATTSHSLSTSSMPMIGLTVCASAFAIVSLVLRLQLGVDLTDEAWYLATPYRYLLGDRPFVDEIFLMQGFALFTYPVLKLLGFGATSDGIVLWGRALYTLFNATVACALAYSLRRQAPWSWLVVCASGWILFIPYGIPNLSYNTMGLGFLTLALSAGIERVVNGARIGHWFFSGVFAAAACTSHVSLVVATAVLAVSLLLAEGRSRWTALACYVAGGLSVVILLTALYGITLAELVRNYDLTLMMNTAFHNRPDAQKLLRVAQSAFIASPFLTALGLLVLTRARKPHWRKSTSALLFYAIVPLAYWTARASRGGMGPHGLTFYVGMLAPFVFVHLRHTKTTWWLLLGGWLPPAVAAFSTSTTSYNGLGSGGVPSLFCAVITMVFLYQWYVEQWSPATRPTESRAWHVLVPWLLWIALLGYLNTKNLYYEDPPHELTRRIAAGPFRGLFTSETKERILREANALVPVTPQHTSAGRVLFYPFFPAGYLLSSRLPLSPSTWGCMGLPPSICLDYARAKKSPEDLWIRVNRLYLYQGLSYDYQDPEPWDAFLKAPPTRNPDFEKVEEANK